MLERRLANYESAAGGGGNDICCGCATAAAAAGGAGVRGGARNSIAPGLRGIHDAGSVDDGDLLDDFC